MASRNDYDDTLPPAEFIKVLTAAGLSTASAIGAVSKLSPAKFNTLEKLSSLSTFDLDKIGIKGTEDRKALLAISGKKRLNGKLITKTAGTKRKRDADLDQALVPSSSRKAEIQTDFSFDEILDDKTLQSRMVVINRAPCMQAWATVVAESQGFSRPEALSLASVYTELNAISKGVSIGVMNSSNKDKAPSAQPAVLLMGRDIPVLSLQSGEWRALSKGAIAEPSASFGYLQRSFRQQLGGVVGAMRLLASTLDREELNSIGYSLYCDFRPAVDGWGKKAELSLATILNLRRLPTLAETSKPDSEDGGKATEEEGEPPAKKSRGASTKAYDYEHALDDDDDFDWDSIP